MTVEPTTGSGVAIPYDDLESGLEDFTISDAMIPRISINHKMATFVDNLTKVEYSTLTVVLLGLVKQRVMWDSVLEEGDRPQCKSTDFQSGYPNLATDIPARKQFPWKESVFDINTVPKDGEGNLALPCEACKFKDWGSDGSKPRCSEQHTYPLLYVDTNGALVPGLFTVQKTGIKPSRQYVSSFARSHTPLYTVYTELSLRAESRGVNTYAVPIFKQGDATAAETWGQSSQQYKDLRSFLRQPPVRREDEESEGFTPSDNKNAAPEASPASPAPAAAPPVSAPSPAPAAASTPAPAATPAADGPDDLPF